MKTTYTASDARANFYELYKLASQGLANPVITRRGANPVIMMSQEEYESWMETLDILSNSEEVAAIKVSLGDKKRVSLKELTDSLNLDES